MMCAANSYRNLTNSKTKNHRKPPSSSSSPRSLLPIDFAPGPKDVLCGRGNVFTNHAGNQSFNRVIRASLSEYKEAPNRASKIKVVDAILGDLRSSGVRFIKTAGIDNNIDNNNDDDDDIIRRLRSQYYELTDVQAHQKIGHAIRDTLRLLKDKSNDDKSTTALKQSRKRPTTKKTTTSRKANPQMNLEAIEGLRDTFQRILPKPQKSASTTDRNDRKASSSSSTLFSPSLPPPSIPPFRFLERSTSLGPYVLEGEYPEEGFDFSARSFFGDLRLITTQ